MSKTKVLVWGLTLLFCGCAMIYGGLLIRILSLSLYTLVIILCLYTKGW